MPGERATYCRFLVGDRIAYGVLDGEQVIELTAAPFGPHERTSTRHDVSSVKLAVPTVPNTFFCAGRNYAGHIRAMAHAKGQEPVFPDKPEIGYRSNTALIAHEEPIVKPVDASDQFQYEGELVAVFGRRARHVSPEEALGHVFGWTIGNDVTERAWQRADPAMWRSKNADTFKPMGPWIVTGLDPSELRTRIRLNGRITDEFATGEMLFDVATYISEVTKYITIHPGDVMWFGTDGLPENMKPGDVVEIEIDGIGVLRNPVVAEEVDG